MGNRLLPITLLAGVLLAAFACAKNSVKDVAQNQSSIKVDSLDSLTVSSPFNFDTVVFNSSGGRVHIRIVDPDYSNSDSLVLRVSIDVGDDSVTLVSTSLPKGSCSPEFRDIDGDGNLDILYQGFPQMCNGALYLFDKQSGSFVRVEGFDELYEISPLRANPRYYYSYVRRGCADMNWESSLLTFRNLKLVELAYIDGQGCDGAPRKMYIYTLSGSMKKALFKTLPIVSSFDKFDFIDRYWNENYAKFSR